MSVSDVDMRQRFTGDGATTDFAIPFDINATASDEVQVYTVDESVSPAVETLKVITTHYTIVTSDTIVRFGTAPATGIIVLIIRKIALTQTLNLSATGAVPMEDIETAFDRSTSQIQFLREKIDRALKFRISSTNQDIEVPDISAGTYLKWNSGGTALENASVVGMTAPASSTDNALVRWDGVLGTTIQNSVGILSDAGAMSGLTQFDCDNLRIDGNTLSSTSGAVNLTPLAGQAIVLDTSVTVDGGVVTVTGNIAVDNLDLNGNTLSSTSGAINITPIAGSAVVLDTSVTVDGGVVTVTGNIAVDNLDFNGNTISSTSGGVSITPLAGQVITLDTNMTVDGGVVVITGDLSVDNLKIDGNTISSTSSSLRLTPLAGQAIVLDTDVSIDGGVVNINGDLTVDNFNINGDTISTTSGGIRITPAGGSAITLDTSMTVDGGVVAITGDLSVDNLNLNGNTLSSTNANGNIAIEPNGSGLVTGTKEMAWSGDVAIGQATAPVATALLECVSTTKVFYPPRMTTAQRDGITPTIGAIIANTTTNAMNYYSGSAWVEFGATGTVSDDTVTAPKLDESAVGFGDIINHGITVSIGAGAMTVDLVGADGAALSASNVCIIPFRNATVTTGTPTIAKLTAAPTSLVMSSGSTGGMVGGSLAQSAYIGIFNDAGTYKLAYTKMNSVDEGSLQSSTDEAANGDSGILIYTTDAVTAVSSKAFKYLARLDFTGIVTAGTWVAPAKVMLAPFDKVIISAVYGDAAGGTAVNGTTIPYATKVYDTSGTMNAAGTFTIPVAGKATVSATFRAECGGTNSVNQYANIYLTQAGSAAVQTFGAADVAQITADHIISATVVGIFDVVAGDTIVAKVEENLSSSPTLAASAVENRFSILIVPNDR